MKFRRNLFECSWLVTRFRTAVTQPIVSDYLRKFCHVEKHVVPSVPSRRMSVFKNNHWTAVPRDLVFHFMTIDNTKLSVSLLSEKWQCEKKDDYCNEGAISHINSLAI